MTLYSIKIKTQDPNRMREMTEKERVRVTVLIIQEARE